MSCPSLADHRALIVHLDATADHGLSCEEWALLLLHLDPRQYRDRPPPDSPAVAMTTEARVEVYRQRARARVGLYHAADSWRGEAQRTGVEAGRGPNGAAYGREIHHG